MILLSLKKMEPIVGVKALDQGNTDSHKPTFAHQLCSFQICATSSLPRFYMPCLSALSLALLVQLPHFLFLHISGLSVCTELQVSMLGTEITGMCYYAWLFPIVV